MLKYAQKHLLICFGWVVLALTTSVAQAQLSTSLWDRAIGTWNTGRVSHQLEVDNDSLLFQRRDGFYTSGMRYTQQFELHAGNRLDRAGWRIGQEIYTSSDIKLAPAALNPSDHPYAGWLYGGVFQSAYFTNGQYYRYGLDLGCVGPCSAAQWTQQNLHRVINQPQPQAWSSQIRNEFGVLLYGEYVPRRWQFGSTLDLTPSVHARFGNIFTDAGAGIQLRAGRLNQLPDQSTVHVFLRLDARAVAYNASLQGGYFSTNNPHTVSPERAVGAVELGMVWNQEPFAVQLSVVRRSSGIAGLSNAIAAQNFVRLMFSYTST